MIQQTFKEYLMYEMTLNIGNTQSDDKVIGAFDFLKTNGKVIGHQDQLEILKATYPEGIIYGIQNSNEEITTIGTFKEISKNVLELYVIHTLSRFRGRADAARLLWFLKSQEGMTIIDYGVQTNDGIRFIKSLGISKRFELSWFNTKTKEKIPYDYNKDGIDNSPYRSQIKMTDWKILIEGDEYPSLPRFFNKEPFPNGNTWILFEDATND